MNTQTVTIIFLLILNCCRVNAAAFKCLLTGTVTDRSTGKTLILKRASIDPRSAMCIRIPIVANRFEYTLTTDSAEAWQLIFEDELAAGAFKPITFFADSSSVSFELFPMAQAEEKNRVFGGLQNRNYYDQQAIMANTFKTQYMDIKKARNVLVANRKYYTAGYDSLTTALRVATSAKEKTNLYRNLEQLNLTGESLTPEGKMNKKAEAELLQQLFDQRYAYIRQNINAAAYQMIFEDIQNNIPAIDKAYAIYPTFRKAFPKHPYSQILSRLIAGKALRPGQYFKDISAPDLSGKMHKLSDIMAGKITLLDMWASWCGPCINKTRQMMPVYREFNDKGFQVVGVAREFKDLDNLKLAIEREKHPWLTLAELEDKAGIWNTYGLNNSGGGMILIDRSGKILAVDPTADDLRKILLATL